ncbi:hypothetical protein Ct61P_11924 [Colletotrichum tofieldiae]|nr:hypothetical protein Ct61P_11924 [Colletotrichum tofieldiae]
MGDRFVHWMSSCTEELAFYPGKYLEVMVEDPMGRWTCRRPGRDPVVGDAQLSDEDVRSPDSQRNDNDGGVEEEDAGE